MFGKKVRGITRADADFIRTRFKQITGWCAKEAAYLTYCLMGCQNKAGLSAGVVEIGVYKGKYLSILYQKARQYGQPVVGIDPFEWSPRQDAVNALQRAFGSIKGLSLVAADSHLLTANDLIEMLGNVRASFVSVDGDHSAEGVKSDLVLARAVLAPGGIIAIDDFMNPRQMGVSEGVYRYFFDSGESSIGPFAHTGNKLFVADRDYQMKYIEAISTFAAENADLPMIRNFNQAYEQRILGSRVRAV